MFPYVFVCALVLVVAPSYGGNTTLSNSGNSTNKTSTEKLLNTERLNTNQVNVISEGETQITPAVTLLNNVIQPLHINGEKVVNKSKIVPRKGAKFSEENVAENVTSTKTNQTFEDDKSLKIESNSNTTHKIMEIMPIQPDNSTPKLHTIKTTEKVSTTQVPKKPLFLSYEKLSSINDNIDLNKKLKMYKTVTSSALQSDDKGSTLNAVPITSKINTNSHPTMIMPVVVTILVVPVFAILGYMALKRSQEAWKNRHYKRMDFLLDGMYHD